MSAGYSGTPLPKKLGIKEGAAVALLGAPDGFDATLGALPSGVDVQRTARPPQDVVVFFTKKRGELAKRLPSLTKAIAPAGALWVAWPRKASGVPTDITEDVIRDIALPTGLVDNKVCAIDGTWSGLRLVIRRENREPGGSGDRRAAQPDGRRRSERSPDQTPSSEDRRAAQQAHGRHSERSPDQTRV